MEFPWYTWVIMCIIPLAFAGGLLSAAQWEWRRYKTRATMRAQFDERSRRASAAKRWAETARIEKDVYGRPLHDSEGNLIDYGYDHRHG